MAKITTDFSDAKNPDWLNGSHARMLGSAVVGSMKKMIAQGVSPVRGEGRFTRYSEQVPSKPSNYPRDVRGRFRGKKTRPVNLSLNGWYLSHLTYWWNKKRQYIGIGFSGKSGTKQPVSKKVRDYFEAHNEGMNKANGVPKRKHLPNAKGDMFSISVEREYLKSFERAVKSAINKMNKR